MIGQTLYAKYIKERENAQVLENESGFITYKFINDECFICDVFVDPKARKKGVISELVDALAAIAEQEQATHLSANIYLNDPGANRTLSAALKIGFEVVGAAPGALAIVRKIGGA